MKIARTQRLVIERFTTTDIDFILKLVNSPNWLQFIGDREIKKDQDAIAYIQNSLLNSYDKNGYGLYKMSLKVSAIPIGICGFVQRDYLEHPDIGFAILPSYQEKGYTYEAAKAVLDYGITSLNFTTILAITTEKNLRSRKLLSKLNLKEIGKIQPKQDKEELLLFSN